MVMGDETPTPRTSEPSQRIRPKPIHQATIDKTILKMPSPRVQNKQAPKKTTPARMKMREQIKKHIETKTMAWIPQQSTYLKQNTRSTEWAQLIHNKETNTYLNY
jgi:hypothetical protein